MTKSISKRTAKAPTKAATPPPITGATPWAAGLERARAALYRKFHASITGPDAGFMYEKIIQQLFAAALSPGDSCIDVGANKGYHTFAMAAAVGAGGKVYAFEAIPELNALLEERAKRDQIGQIEFICTALGASEGQVTFFNIKNYTPLSGLKLRSPPADAVIEEIRVPLRRLDDCIDASTDIRFIKIDVEGGELDVLKGGLRLIQNSRPIIAFEDGRDKAAANYGYSIDDYFALLSEAEMVPLDMLGARITRANWTDKRCYYTVLCPRESLDETSEIVRLTVTEKGIGAVEAIRRARAAAAG